METIPDTMSLDRKPKYSLHQINRNIRVGLVKELVEGAYCLFQNVSILQWTCFQGQIVSVKDTSMKSIDMLCID